MEREHTKKELDFEYNDREFVKIFRKFTKWEWYTDVNTKVLFLHCILRANWKGGSWRGCKYKRGEFITSLRSLSRETGLSFQQIRTAFKHLESTGEVTYRTTNKYRVVTINMYDEYQKVNKQKCKQATSNQQTTNKQLTNNQQQYKNIKNIKNNKENKEGASPSFIYDGVSPFPKYVPEYPETMTEEELKEQGWELP